MSGYYLLKNGEYAYNKSYSVGYDFGSVKRLDRYDMGALSTLYICFALKKHDSDFIKTYFDSLKWYREIYMISAEGARNHGLLNVPTDEFFDTKHYIPMDSAEQRKIADFVIALEHRIEAQQSLVDNLKKYKRGALSKLFPQKGEIVPQYRFAGFTDPWEQRKLGEITKTNPFKQFIAEGTPDGTYEVIQQGDTPVVGYADGDPFEDYESISLFGDHTLSLYKPKGPFFVASDGVKILSPSISMNGLFYYYLLMRYKPNSEGYKRHYTILKGCEALYPTDCEEQIKIGKYFSHLDNLITLHKRKLNEFENIKSGLLQQMFI